MSAVSTGVLPTRSEIESWEPSELDDAAARWRRSADEADDAFVRHRLNVGSPGATTWSGDAHDAAVSGLVADSAVAGRQSELQREAAAIAETGAADSRAAQRTALAAIAEAWTQGLPISVATRSIAPRRWGPPVR